MFTGFEQNDLPEFLIFIIDCFHNALSREVNMTIQGTIKDAANHISNLILTIIKPDVLHGIKEEFEKFVAGRDEAIKRNRIKKALGVK